MGEGGDWWSCLMGVIAKGILRGCQGLFTPVSLGYPLSVSNKKLYSQNNVKHTHTQTPDPINHVHPKTLIEMWITYLDPVSDNSEKCIGSQWVVRVGQRLQSGFGKSRAESWVWYKSS